MSYISQEVYQYSGKPYISALPNQQFNVQAPTLISNSSQMHPNAPRPLENFGESQVNNVFRPISHLSNPQPTYQLPQSPPLPQLIDQRSTKGVQFNPQGRQLLGEKSQRTHEVPVNINIDHRYDQYLEKAREEEYKYNIFSIMDQPWNRCISGERCGKFPPNECIAPESFRKYWK